MFSPPTWGWSVNADIILFSDHVLRTHVGMVRNIADNIGFAASSRHPRGDGPEFEQALWTMDKFSPHT